MNNINKITNKKEAEALKKDLYAQKEEGRTLKELSNASVSQLFGIFGIKDPKCDKNNDGKVAGDELKCLGKVWKSFVPS